MDQKTREQQVMNKKIRKSIKKKCPQVPDQAGTSNTVKQFHDNSPIAQQARILSWFLNISPRLSTLEAREELGIMSPACRIMELRDMGHDIITDREQQVDVTGTNHPVGVYVYMGFPITNQVKETDHVTHKND